jgi:uncharacterized cupin superfamily protein
MSRQRADRWAQFIRAVIVAASLVVAMCVLAVGGVLFWTEFWHVPKLVYTVLPTYDYRGQSVNGLMVENRGREAAHQVVIRVVDLEEPIETFRIKTNEQLSGQEADEQNISVWLDRMVPGSFVTLYIPTEQAVALEGYLSITAEEGRAVSALSQEELNSAMALALVGVIIVFLMIIGGVIGWMLARMIGRG